MAINDEIFMSKEIDTLNENIERKNNVIAGLYSVIVDTKDLELLAKAAKVMLDANL